MAGRALRIRTVILGSLGALGLLTVIGALSVYFITHAVRRAAEALAESSGHLEDWEQTKGSVLQAARASNLSIALRDPAFDTERELSVDDVRRESQKARASPRNAEEALRTSEVMLALQRWDQAAQAMGGVRTFVDPRALSFRRATDAALQAMQALINFETIENLGASAQVRRWHQRAIVTAVGLIAVYLLIAALYLLLLRSTVFAPLEELDQSLDRYSRGEREVRAAPGGVRELRRLGATFNRMAEALGRQRQQQLAFLLAVAHDMRNPLAGLRAASATLRPGRPLPDETSLRKTMALVARQIASLDRLTDDLVETVQVESGAFGLRLQRCDLRHAISETAELYQGVSKLHTLKVDVPDEAVIARCDPDRVGQILNNLVSNAIKYSPAGGTVTIALRRTGQLAELAVSDCGVGVPAAERSSIFEPFHRGSATRGWIPGVGIGLSVVRALVVAHGGQILLDSKQGEGSTFRVLLPLAAEPPESEVAPSPHPAPVH